MKIKRRKTDTIFSNYMRLYQDWTCQKCGKKYVFDGVKVHSLSNLGVSHYWGRSCENTRFEVTNCDILCNFPCHHYWESDPNGKQEYKEFMVKKLGQEGYDQLEVAAHIYKKRDDKMTEIILKEVLKQLIGGNE